MNIPDLPEQILQLLQELAYSRVPGAKSLRARILQLESADETFFRIRENIWTEGFAVWFANRILNLQIIKIESKNDILSPFRRRAKSCDVFCRDSTGKELYIETKDKSSDLIKRHGSGEAGYSPQTHDEVIRWLSNRVYDCIEKGANLLIARIPVYLPDWRPIDESDIHFELFGKRNPQSSLDLRISEDIPSYFDGVWVIKNGAHAFYTVRRQSS